MSVIKLFKRKNSKSQKYENHVTNIGLYNILSQFFEECWNDGTASERSKEKICSVIYDIQELLNKYPDHLSKNKICAGLSYRQVACGIEAIKLAMRGDISHALYSFMDCIDNYGEVYRVEREITPNEYMIYLGIASVIRGHIGR